METKRAHKNAHTETTCTLNISMQKNNVRLQEILSNGKKQTPRVFRCAYICKQMATNLQVSMFARQVTREQNSEPSLV